MRARDWLRSFQTANPADGRRVAIGFLSSSAGAFDLFRLHEDDGVDTKKEREGKQENTFSGREQRKLHVKIARYVRTARLSHGTADA